MCGCFSRVRSSRLRLRRPCSRRALTPGVPRSIAWLLGCVGVDGVRQPRQVTVRASASQWPWVPAARSVAHQAQRSGRRSSSTREGMLMYSVQVDRRLTGNSSSCNWRRLCLLRSQSWGPRSSIDGSVGYACSSGASQATDRAASRIHASRAKSRSAGPRACRSVGRSGRGSLCAFGDGRPGRRPRRDVPAVGAGPCGRPRQPGQTTARSQRCWAMSCSIAARRERCSRLKPLRSACMSAMRCSAMRPRRAQQLSESPRRA
jgi:hypothetical protein